MHKSTTTMNASGIARPSPASVAMIAKPDIDVTSADDTYDESPPAGVRINLYKLVTVFDWSLCGRTRVVCLKV